MKRRIRLNRIHIEEDAGKLMHPHDYRYFPEPDLAPIIIDAAEIGEIRKALPEMPEEKRKRFKYSYGLNDKEIDILGGDKALARYYESLTGYGADPKTGANWLLGSMLNYHSEKTQAAGFLMGQIMKASRGKANPQLARELLERQLKQKV